MMRSISAGMSVVVLGLSYLMVLSAGASTTPFQMASTPDEILHRLDSSKIDRAQVDTIVKQWRQARKPANSENLPPVDADMEQFRDKILAAKTPDALGQLLATIPIDYEKYSPSLKYLSAQLYMLAPLRGIVWRTRRIFEAGSGFNGNRAVQSQVVTAIRALDDVLHVNLNTDQWRAAFDYLTIPDANDPKATQFKTVSDFQKWVYHTYIPTVQMTITALDGIYKSNPKQALVIDRQIGYGTATFVDGLNRFEGHSLPEIAATLSALHYSLHSMYFFCAYNQDQMIDVAAKVGTMMGVESYFSEDLGFTQEHLRDILTGYRGKNYLSKNPGGDKLMGESLIELQQSVHWASVSWKSLQGLSGTQERVINPIFFQTENNIATKRALENAEGIVSGQFPISSRLTGEVATVNLPAFYQHPPQSLLDFLPQTFEPGAEELPIPGSTSTYRNYLRGRATGWNHSAFQTFVISATPTPGEDYLITAARVAHQTPGASLLLAPVLAWVK
jgi:hypothetical protein